MRKKEFLNELSKRLENMSARDRDDILEYYDELVEDTIEKTGKYEEEVVRDLGTLDDIVRRVTIKETNTNQPKDDKKIYYDEFGVENHDFEEDTKESKEEKHVKEENKENNRASRMTVETETTSKANNSKTNKTYKNNDRLVIGIIIAVVTFPIWLGFLMAFVGIIVGVVTAGIGLGVAGVALVVQGIISFAANATYAALQIGVGLALSGIACIVAPLIVKLLVFIVKQVEKLVKWLVNSNRRTLNYEN